VAVDVTEWLGDGYQDGVKHLFELRHSEALEAIKGWARDCGAWDREEIEGWTDVEVLALLVQNVASELRALGSDDLELIELVEPSQNEDTNTSGCLYLYTQGDDVFGEYYFGC
jgi:hypothetical protein